MTEALWFVALNYQECQVSCLKNASVIMSLTCSLLFLIIIRGSMKLQGTLCQEELEKTMLQQH